MAQTKDLSIEQNAKITKKLIRPILEFCTDIHKNVITIEQAKKRFSQQVTNLKVYVAGSENAQKFLDGKLESINPIEEVGANIASIDCTDDENEEADVKEQSTLIQLPNGTIAIAGKI